MRAAGVVAGLVAAALWIATIIKVVQAVRRPDDRGVRLLIVLFAPMALSVTISTFDFSNFGVNPFAATLDPLLGPLSGVMVRNLAIAPAMYGGLAFLLYSSGLDEQQRRLRLLRITIVTWAVVTLVSWYSVPTAVRGASFADVSEPGRVVYYVVGIVAISLTTVFFGARWTAPIARSAPDRRVRAGLWVAVAGFVLVLPLFSLPRLAALGIAFAGGTPPGWLTAIAAVAQFIVIAMFVLGFFWPVALARFIAVQQWIIHARLAAQIQPLLDSLQVLSPGVRGASFAGVGSGGTVRGVHSRFYRTVVECRDGLVLAGRMIGDDSPAERTPEQEAEMLRAILNSPPEHMPSSGTPGIKLAQPDGDTAEDDARALAALAQALQRASATSTDRTDAVEKKDVDRLPRDISS